MTGKDKFIQACNDAIVDIEFLLNKENITLDDLYELHLSGGLCYYITKKWADFHYDDDEYGHLLHEDKKLVGYLGDRSIRWHITCIRPKAELNEALTLRMNLAKSSIDNIDKIIEINPTLKWD